MKELTNEQKINVVAFCLKELEEEKNTDIVLYLCPNVSAFSSQFGVKPYSRPVQDYFPEFKCPEGIDYTRPWWGEHDYDSRHKYLTDLKEILTQNIKPK